MLQDMALWFSQIFIPEIRVILTSALPVLEIKAAIPLGLGMGMHPVHAFVLSYFGSLLPVPFLFLLIRPIFFQFKKVSRLRDRIVALEAKTIRKSVKIQKYGAIGLFLFVAIPLPGTGVWTGSLGAVLLDIRFKWAFPAICLGNLIAGLIIMTISIGAINLF